LPQQGGRQELSVIETTLSLLPSSYAFPRKVMTLATKGQVTIYSKEELIEVVEKANSIDCFIQSHSDLERDLGVLSLLYIDIDNENDIDQAKKDALRTSRKIERIYGIRPHVQFSGCKGYHVLLPFEPKELPNGKEELRNYLQYLREYLSNGKCDPSLKGDIVRLFRLPYSYNSKGIVKYGDGLVRVVQEWDGNRADSRTLYGAFKVWQLDRKLKSGKRGFTIKTKSEGKFKIRKPIQELIELAKEGQRLEHRQRLAILLELINTAMSNEEIISIFEKQDDFNPSKIQYFIDHARTHGYKPFKRESLMEVISNV
jgi:hypothetical protein